MQQDVATHVFTVRWNRKIAALLVVVLVVGAGTLATSRGRNLAWSSYTRLMGRATVEQRLAQVGPAARARLSDAFSAHGVPYPPARVALLAAKEERESQVYVSATQDSPAWKHLKSYRVLGSSGASGPKLAEGDMQVPEGIYKIESLNPNSRFHLSLRVQYPNDHDRTCAKSDGRTQLGSDIMIHGGSASVGCLAMGDPAIEELFVLAADVGIENIDVIIAPRDLRVRNRAGLPTEPKWIGELYDEIEAALKAFPTPSVSGGSG